MPATGVAAHSGFLCMSTEPLSFESPGAVEAVNPTAAAAPGLDEQKRQKKRNKVRSAWISFVGRIVAQFVGASASIILGMALLQKYQTAHANPADAPPAVTPVAQHPTVASRDRGVSGQPSVAVLPLEAFSAEPRHKELASAMTEILSTT